MIIKFKKYCHSNEIGSKFIVYDNVKKYTSTYCKLFIAPVKGGGFVFKNQEHDSVIMNECIYNSNFIKTKVNKELSFLKIEFTRKTDNEHEDYFYYTDNEVFICNDNGQTIEKFRNL